MVAFSLFGLDYLTVLIFHRSDLLGLTWCLGMSLGLYAIELGAKPTEAGRKNDLKVLVFLTIFVIIAIIIICNIWEKVEFIKLLEMCINFSFMTIAAYLGMAVYTNWRNKRSIQKKNKEIFQE
jgi:hypothetical protein